MALTRVQPSAIDSSQNYSVNTLSANTVLDGGIEIISIANGAFLQANSAYDAANSAFAKANVPSGITYTTSNNAPVGPKLGDQWYNTYNNILFEYISDGTTNLWIDVSSTTITSNVGYATDTVAQNLAISAFDSANNNAAVNTTQNTNITLVGNFANGAFGLANTHTTNISTIQGVDTTQNTNISLASSYANGAFTKANSALANTTGTFAGDLTITGNNTINGIIAGYAPNRPAFRVSGSGTTNNLTTTQNGTGCLTANNWTIEYTQGNYLSNTTGVFTAPIAGLYQVNVIGRNSGYSAGISQIGVTRNGSSGGTVGGQCILMVEWAANSTMNHAGGSTTIKLAAGDFLACKVLAGQINFDGNDNWSVTYLG